MSLTALPGELLFQIAETISRTTPNDIECIGRTSYRLRGVAAPLIKEHRKLLKQYTKLHVDNAGAANTLFEICKRPWVAFYPHILEVSANRNRRTLERPRNAKERAVTEDVAVKRSMITDDDLEALMLGTGLIPAPETYLWMNGIIGGDEDYLFALLLACLPSLQRFVIRLDLNKMEQIKEMVRAIKKNWPRRQTLPNLRTVHVLEREGSSTSDLEMFPLFAAIPGVQNMRGSNLTGMYRECYRDGWLSYPGASASITHISLEACGMSVEGLEMLMKSLRNLQSFRYVAHRAGWCLYAISDLLKNARPTLHTLELSTGAGGSRYIGSLKEFTALKYVTVDTDMLIQRGKIQRFVDLMPASIVTCHIAGNNLTRPVEELFLADLFRPSFYYPHLKNIWAEDSWGRRNIGQDRLRFQKEFHKQTTWMMRYR
ncbi:MAG: hypothetical protein Q9217_006474 [Psora testacea]